MSALGGVDARNYDFTTTPVVGNHTVDQLALKGAAIGAGATTYGTPAATGAVTLGNKVGIDDVSVGAATIVSPATSGSGNLNAGAYKQTVGSALSGVDAGNYTFGGFTTATNNYTVDKLGTAVGGIRVYNATNAVAGTDITSIGNLVAGDVVAVGGIGAVADKNVGVNKPLTDIGSLVLTGADAGNYNLLASGSTWPPSSTA